MPKNILTLSVSEFLTATASKQPTPGGGSVAALAGALSASLAAMALEYTVGKKAAEPFDAKLRAALSEFQTASAQFEKLITDDIHAYAALSPLLKLPPDERAQNPQFLTAIVDAIRAPQSTLLLAGKTLFMANELLDYTNKFLITDLGIAATLAFATIHASELNILINLPLLPNASQAHSIKSDTASLVSKAEGLYTNFRANLLTKL